MKINDKKFIAYFVLFLLLFVFMVRTYEYFYDKDLNNNGVVSVGKLIKISAYKNGDYAVIKYFVYPNEHIIHQSHNKERWQLNAFYSIIYSENNPKKAKVDFSKTITDTIAIQKAGFTYP